jgi:peptide deformylase
MNILDLENSKIDIFEKIIISNQDIYLKAQKMEDICIKKNIISLSAIQLGLPINLFVYCSNFPNSKNFSYFLDCSYNPLDEKKFISIESCASVIGKNYTRRFKINRYESIVVRGKKFDENGKLVTFESNLYKGLDCAVFQHEIDHFNKILISEIGEEIYPLKGLV